MPEIRKIPSVGHEAVKGLSEAERGLHRIMGEIVRRKEATIFGGMPLPRDRSIGALTPEHGQAIDPIVNSNTHDSIA